MHSDTRFAVEQEPQQGIIGIEGQCSERPCTHYDSSLIDYPPFAAPSTKASCGDGYMRFVSSVKNLSTFCIEGRNAGGGRESVCDAAEPCGSNVTAHALQCADGPRVWDREARRFCTSCHEGEVKTVDGYCAISEIIATVQSHVFEVKLKKRNDHLVGDFNTAKALGCGILSRHASLRRAPMRHAPMSRLHTLRTSVDHMRSLKAPSFPSLPESSPSAICPPPAMMHYVWMCPPLVDIST